jgi:type I restriction enzyme R subunit
MTITEPEIEKLAINLLEKQGYQHIYAPDIAPDSDNPLRNGFDDVLLEQKLKSAIDRINPDTSPESREDAIRQVKRIHSPELIVGNEEFYIMLTEGVNITTRKNGEDRGDYIKLVDFNNLENNEFNVVNQFTVIENNQNKRPDIILFVNGIPLVVIELKNATNEYATISSAYKWSS